jgi:outer membrane protein TolC
VLLLTTLAIAIAPAEPTRPPAPVAPTAAPTTAAPASSPTPEPNAQAGAPAGSATEASPTATVPPVPYPEAGLPDDYAPPFASDTLQLSEVLTMALKDNIDLATNTVDAGISEANVLAAQGAYDLILIAGINGSASKTPQRGSQFTIATGARSLGANVGFSRRFVTGGTLSLRVDVSRSQQDQAANFLNANAGSTTLSTYRISPTLTVTHPLLQGAGLAVGRAEINKAKIAVSSAEATKLITAQNLVRDIVSAYWDVLAAHRDLLNKRNSVALAAKQLERTRALVTAGRMSPVDAKAVEQALAARESDVYTAENTLLDRSLTLRTLMGQDFDGSDTLGVLPATDPVVKPREVNISDEIDRALAQNPQVRQLELQLASGRIDEKVAANARLPQLEFSGSFSPVGRSTDQSADQTTGDPGMEGNWGEAFRNFFPDSFGDGNGFLADWTVQGSLSLTWDVRNRTAKARHQAAKLQIKRAETTLTKTRQTVAAGVIRAANGLRTAGKVMEVSEISVDLAKENLAAEQARFDVGRSTNYDVLLRLDELDRAEAQALAAQINYLKAIAQLQALSGEILPAYNLDVP